ncbi:MAG TPA: response regulator [Puia sp.]|jgi:DNA-binding response OmpR family regulator
MESYLQLVLADDDEDDCLLFRHALSELSLKVHLTIVHDGDDLFHLLNESEKPPAAVILDLNMPRKTGFECLDEMQDSENFHAIPVIIFSTSVPENLSIELRKRGARDCFQKPSEYKQLKALILHILKMLEPEVLQRKVNSDDGNKSS